MATYDVDDIVRKIGGTQKYKVVEVSELITTEQKYVCVFEPPMAMNVQMKFKESDIEAVS